MQITLNEEIYKTPWQPLNLIIASARHRGFVRKGAKWEERRWIKRNFSTWCFQLKIGM